MGTLKKLQGYMGQRRILFPLSLILSALSALAGLVPYILIWLIVKELLYRQVKLIIYTQLSPKRKR